MNRVAVIGAGLCGAAAAAKLVQSGGQVTPVGIIAFPDQQLWAGGEWSYSGRVENTYLAGLDLAGAVIHHSSRTNVTT